mgnify:CR=1 FL=1
MNEYAATEARRLLSNSKSFRALTVMEAYIFLDELKMNLPASNDVVEIGMLLPHHSYISDKTLVCRFILSLATPGWMDEGNTTADELIWLC